jgi:hypothetical protein
MLVGCSACAKNETFGQARLDTRFARPNTCREVNLLPNPSASRLDTLEDTILLLDPFEH